VFDDGESLGVVQKPSSEAAPGSIEAIYQKKTQREHILLRPEPYVGSMEKTTVDHWVFDRKHVGQFVSASFPPSVRVLID
jgi:DNA topoisomerase-2